MKRSIHKRPLFRPTYVVMRIRAIWCFQCHPVSPTQFLVTCSHLLLFYTNGIIRSYFTHLWSYRYRMSTSQSHCEKKNYVTSSNCPCTYVNITKTKYFSRFKDKNLLGYFFKIEFITNRFKNHYRNDLITLKMY